MNLAYARPTELTARALELEALNERDLLRRKILRERATEIRRDLRFERVLEEARR